MASLRSDNPACIESRKALLDSLEVKDKKITEIKTDVAWLTEALLEAQKEATEGATRIQLLENRLEKISMYIDMPHHYDDDEIINRIVEIIDGVYDA